MVFIEVAHLVLPEPQALRFPEPRSSASSCSPAAPSRTRCGKTPWHRSVGKSREQADQCHHVRALKLSRTFCGYILASVRQEGHSKQVAVQQVRILGFVRETFAKVPHLFGFVARILAAA